MANNYIRTILMACCILMASHLSAQFRFGDKPSIGQTLNVDTETGIATFLLDFNTDRPNSTWTLEDTVITISFQKCQTNRGIQSEVFVSDDSLATTIYNEDFRVRRWNSNENPVHMASIDSLTAILAKWAEKYAGMPEEENNVIWKPSACLFDVNGDDTNQAFGTHPGQYKRVKYGFQFSFSGTAVTSDIVFEIDTYDAGNTGQTASYTLVVALGSESNIVATIPDYYVSGDPKKTVNLAADIGMDFTGFSNDKVYIWLETQGTGTPVAMDSFDPTIVFDNMAVSYQLPLWIDPPAGAEVNAILGNMDDPFVGFIDEPAPASIHLQTESRFGSLEIVNDLQDPAIQNLTFPETGALKANDGSGNYTVDVPYTLDPAIFDSGTQTWTKAKITVAAPESGSVDDDMLFFFNAAPSSEPLHFARLELNNGTRIWFDFYMQGVVPEANLLYVGARGPGEMLPSDSVSIAQLENAGYKVTLIDDNDVASGGYDYSGYDAVVFGESTSSSNVVAFGTIDEYPIPCVMLEPLSVRSDKWGWVENPDPATYPNINDYPGYLEDRNCFPGTTELEILDADHYITQDYTEGAVIPWSSATCGDPETIFAWGFDVNQDMSGGIPLAKNNSEGITNPNLWAIPAGTTTTNGTVTSEKIVVFGIHAVGIYGEDDDMTEYATADFYNLLIRSVEWVLMEDPLANLLYVGARGPDEMLPSDSVSIAQLENAGYKVTLIDDNDVAGGGYDYSGYDAVVFGESTSSSNVVAFGNTDHYPIPCVMLEPLSVRSDKWGWVANPDPVTYPNINDYPGYLEDRNCFPGTTEMEILDADHYITQDYTEGAVIPWSSATCGDPATIFAWGFDVNQDMSGGIPLAKNNSEGITNPSLWAIPAGTTVTDGTTTEHKIVVFGIHALGIYGEDDDTAEYATADFYNLLIRSVEWVLMEDVVEPLAELLYIGAQGPDNIIASDSVSIAQLENAGYKVTLIDDNEVASGGYDYSPYDAVIFGESSSSSNVTAFGNTDRYPAPLLMMEPIAVRTDRWGWVVNPDPVTYPSNSDYPGYLEDRNCFPGTTELQVLNNTHYITQDYAQDTVVEWSTATCGTPEVIFAWGFDLNQDMSGAYPLVKNNSEGIVHPNLWAVPAGTTVTDGTTTEYRTVIFGIHALGIYGNDDDTAEYATEDFYRLMLRSVEWILGAGEDSPLVGTEEVENTRNIVFYPNPANGLATLSFDLQSLGQANLYLVNMIGQRFEVFRNRQAFQGANQVEVNLGGFAPGIYVYQLEVGGKASVGKLIITK